MPLEPSDEQAPPGSAAQGDDTPGVGASGGLQPGDWTYTVSVRELCEFTAMLKRVQRSD